jgi:hypothetical protein
MIDRKTAPYYVLIQVYTTPGRGKQATVYVKEGNFFRSHGGLTDTWGKNWIPMEADSLDDARLKAHASVGTVCPHWHLSQGTAP